MRKLSGLILALLLSPLNDVMGQSPLPPLPSELPVGPATPANNAVQTAPAAPTLPAPTLRPRGAHLPFQRGVNRVQQGVPGANQYRAASTAKPAYPGEEVLAWDSMSKEYNASAGEMTAQFSFAVTNISKQEVTINWVRPSCGCTVAKLPPTPWKLEPGDGGLIEFSVDLRGKYGTLSKYVSVDTSHGQKMLNLKIVIPATANNQNPAILDSRTRNMQLAMADRQAVFKNDCASCHVAPAVGKKGEQLFAAACSICHEAPHRATMVPDLHALKFTPTKDYWHNWISNGKPGSLMPAFAQAQGGPLTDEQIESLAEYLTHYFPQRSVVANGGTPTAED